jgi:flagellar basal body-associated protein FliL
MGNRLKARVLVLHVMAGIVILACAVGIAFARSVPGLWRLIAIAGGILSLGAFAVFCWFQESLGKAQGDAAQSNCD